MEYNLDKFNSLIDQASQAISCDEDCQQQNMINDLRQKYYDAKLNTKTASYNEQMAAKNYITYAKGDDAYDEYITNVLTKKANAIADNIRKFFTLNINKMESELNNYDNIKLNYDNIEELHKKYNNENTELFNDLKYTTSDIITNNRKTYYEDQSIQTLNNIYYVLMFFYIIGVIVFGLSLFLYTTNKPLGFNLLILMLMIVYPFISFYLFKKLYELYNFIISLLPKNVYKTL